MEVSNCILCLDKLPGSSSSQLHRRQNFPEVEIMSLYELIIAPPEDLEKGKNLSTLPQGYFTLCKNCLKIKDDAESIQFQIIQLNFELRQKIFAFREILLASEDKIKTVFKDKQSKGQKVREALLKLSDPTPIICDVDLMPDPTIKIKEEPDEDETEHNYDSEFYICPDATNSNSPDRKQIVGVGDSKLTRSESESESESESSISNKNRTGSGARKSVRRAAKNARKRTKQASLNLMQSESDEESSEVEQKVSIKVDPNPNPNLNRFNGDSDSPCDYTTIDENNDPEITKLKFDYKCDQASCKRRFLNIYSKMMHVVEVHRNFDDNENDNSCPFCYKAFSTKDDILCHMERVHDSEEALPLPVRRQVSVKSQPRSKTKKKSFPLKAKKSKSKSSGSSSDSDSDNENDNKKIPKVIDNIRFSLIKVTETDYSKSIEAQCLLCETAESAKPTIVKGFGNSDSNFLQHLRRNHRDHYDTFMSMK